MGEIFTALLLGLLVGAQHAFEPDHLAAVGTMLPQDRSIRHGVLRGAWWGLGHGSAIAVIGLPLVLLGLRVPEPLEAAADFVVAMMLLALGGLACWRAARWSPEQTVKARNIHKTLPIGLVHGMAGSGAAVVLATAQSPSIEAAASFLIVFVLGSTLSMMATAGFVLWSLRAVAGQPSRTPWLLRASGVLSVVVGIIWAGPHVYAWLG